jgi:hypothetical protein
MKFEPSQPSQPGACFRTSSARACKARQRAPFSTSRVVSVSRIGERKQGFPRLSLSAIFGIWFPGDTASVIGSSEQNQERQSVGLVDAKDPRAVILARKIIDAAKRGERDPALLREQGLASCSSNAWGEASPRKLP